MELVMGCDPHLDSFTVAVTDPTGRAVETARFPNRPQGWKAAAETCRRYQVARVGIEGASGYGRLLARVLSRAGVCVLELPTRLTARMRRIDGAGKSDPGDAVAIARAVTRGEGAVWVDDPALETIRVLTHRREELVRHQTQEVNRLRALLAQIDPERVQQMGRLRTIAGFTALARVAYRGDPHRKAISGLIRQAASDCLHRFHQIRQLEQTLKEVMPPLGWAIIDQVQGAGVITAAQLLAEIAGSAGFASHAKMAAWAGTAPLDVSSGRQQRHRLNRGGNRQANRAIHTITLTQLRHHGPAATYINRRIQEGKTRKEAIRAAKRHITRTIWKIIHNPNLT